MLSISIYIWIVMVLIIAPLMFISIMLVTQPGPNSHNDKDKDKKAKDKKKQEKNVYILANGYEIPRQWLLDIRNHNINVFKRMYLIRKLMKVGKLPTKVHTQVDAYDVPNTTSKNSGMLDVLDNTMSVMSSGCYHVLSPHNNPPPPPPPPLPILKYYKEESYVEYPPKIAKIGFMCKSCIMDYKYYKSNTIQLPSSLKIHGRHAIINNSSENILDHMVDQCSKCETCKTLNSLGTIDARWHSEAKPASKDGMSLSKWYKTHGNGKPFDHYKEAGKWMDLPSMYDE